MKVCSLASGSSGNSLYLETENCKILIDAGISLRQIKLRLKSIDVSIEDIDAVIISHEHIDHTQAISRLQIPVYVSHNTLDLWKDKVNKLHEFDSETAFFIKDIMVTPFSVPHDAVDPVGFTVTEGSNKMGIVTDIGSVTALVEQRLKGCNILVLESNHDSETLMYSAYPWPLKQRIKGRLGHLSNEQSSGLLGNIVHDRLQHVVLAHLSKVNNTPLIAYKESYEILKSLGADHVNLSVAPRKSPGEVLSV